jgi:hypothetical protein
MPGFDQLTMIASGATIPAGYCRWPPSISNHSPTHRYTTTRFAWLATLIVLISGCSTLAERQAADAQLVGKPETESVEDDGASARTREDGGITVLTYEDRHPETVPGTPFCSGPGLFCGGGGFPPPRPAPWSLGPHLP